MTASSLRARAEGVCVLDGAAGLITDTRPT